MCVRSFTIERLAKTSKEGPYPEHRSPDLFIQSVSVQHGKLCTLLYLFKAPLKKGTFSLSEANQQVLKPPHMYVGL